MKECITHYACECIQRENEELKEKLSINEWSAAYACFSVDKDKGYKLYGSHETVTNLQKILERLRARIKSYRFVLQSLLREVGDIGSHARSLAREVLAQDDKDAEAK